MQKLFDEFAAAYARGEHPDAAPFLARAGADADALATQLDSFLAAGPAPPLAEEDLDLFQAWRHGDSALLALRTARGVKRDAVVDALVERLSIDRAKREKVKDYYHRLESGLLEAHRVDPRVFATIAETLKSGVAELTAWSPRPLPRGMYLRAASPRAHPTAAAARMEPQEPDEVDALFGAVNVPPSK